MWSSRAFWRCFIIISCDSCNQSFFYAFFLPHWVLCYCLGVCRLGLYSPLTEYHFSSIYFSIIPSGSGSLVSSWCLLHFFFFFLRIIDMRYTVPGLIFLFCPDDKVCCNQSDLAFNPLNFYRKLLTMFPSVMASLRNRVTLRDCPFCGHFYIFKSCECFV